MKLADEDAWEIGFSCAGDLDVLIEPVDLTDQKRNVFDLYRDVRAALDQGKGAVLATSLQDSSLKLLVLETGETSGTLGSPDLDRAACAVALELVRKRNSCTVALGPDASPFEVFFEVHGPPPTLIVFGAGHVAMPLISLAHDLGLKTVVATAPALCDTRTVSGCRELMIGIPSEIAEKLSYTSSTFVV